MNTTQINAALWDLVNQRNIPESAQRVVEYAMNIPMTSNVVIIATRKKREGGGFTGMTEHGNITLKEECAPKEVVTEFGITRARIGHFKLWRYDTYIEFCHYWAADPTTEDSSGDGVETFYLAYDAKKRKATAFGVWVLQRTGSFLFVTSSTLSVKTIWGEKITRKKAKLGISI